MGRLIENRSMRNIPDNGKVCAYHRYTLGIMWKPQKCSKHADHEYEVGKKAAPTRPAPIHVVLLMQSRHNGIFPIGLALCSKHYKFELTKQDVVTPVTKEHVQDDLAGIDAVDPEYEPEEVTVSDEIHKVSV